MGKEPPGFVPARPASLLRIRPGLEQADRVDLAKRERSPSCPSLPASSSLQAPLSPAASQPRPGASLFSRSQLSLLWGAPSYWGRRRRRGRGRGRRRLAPGAAGLGGGRRARARRDTPAAWAPAAAPLDPEPPRPDSPGSAPSLQDDRRPPNRRRRREPRGLGEPCPRYLKGAHAAVVTTIAGRPVPFLVTAAASTEQLTLTNK